MDYDSNTSNGTYRFTPQRPFNGNKFESKDFINEIAARIASHPRKPNRHYTYVKQGNYKRNPLDDKNYIIPPEFCLREVSKRPTAGTPHANYINQQINDDIAHNNDLTESKAIFISVCQ